LGSLVKREDGKLKSNPANIEMQNPKKYVDTLMAFEDESDLDFEGLISFETGLISNKNLRDVTYLARLDGKLLFAVQSKTEVDENDNWNFALMNSEGKILTKFEYFEIKTEDGKIVGLKEDGAENLKFLLDNSGKATRFTKD
jgi:hypothetical protein